MSKKYSRIGCIADMESPLSIEAFEEVMERYSFIDAALYPPEECDLVIAIGGDGTMLKTLHRYMGYDVDIYGMNRGSVGFMMNSYDAEGILERLDRANVAVLHPLVMKTTSVNDSVTTTLAINEVALLRETNQTAHINIYINGEERLDTLIADGVLLATPAGSTAYNFAANGPILPLNSNLLTLTPIAPFRPRRWRGALLSKSNKVCFNILQYKKRPVSAVADFHEIRDVKRVEVEEELNVKLRVLFDQDNDFEERIIKEQFMP